MCFRCFWCVFFGLTTTLALLLDSDICILICTDDMDPNQPSCSRDIPTASSDDGGAPLATRRLYVSEVLPMWNLIKITDELRDRQQGIAFAEEQGLIKASLTCRTHRTPMRVNLNANRTVGRFECHKGRCRGKSVSRIAGTWFEDIKLHLLHVYYLMYCFALKKSHDDVIFEDPLRNVTKQSLSRPTITDWYSYCREAVVMFQLDQEQARGKIGGPGKIVQIDESKFGKRKYNKGRRVEGHWVLGLIEDGSGDLRLEVCPDNIRSAEVLIPLIKKHVEEGTTIHTDYWKAYDCLDQHGYIHKKVNHSDPDNPFVAPDGTHTQRIESQWRVVKRFFYKENYNNPENFADVIVEFLWRRDVKKYKKDPFMEVVKVVKHVYGVK